MGNHNSKGGNPHSYRNSNGDEGKQLDKVHLAKLFSYNNTNAQSITSIEAPENEMGPNPFGPQESQDSSQNPVYQPLREPRQEPLKKAFANSQYVKKAIPRVPKAKQIEREELEFPD